MSKHMARLTTLSTPCLLHSRYNVLTSEENAPLLEWPRFGGC